VHTATDFSYATFPRPGETLDGAIVLGQMCVLALCVARTAAGLRCGPLGPEGGVALTLALAVAIALGRKLLRFTMRSVAAAHESNPWAASAVAPVIDLSTVRAARGGRNARAR